MQGVLVLGLQHAVAVPGAVYRGFGVADLPTKGRLTAAVGPDPEHADGRTENGYCERLSEVLELVAAQPAQIVLHPTILIPIGRDMHWITHSIMLRVSTYRLVTCGKRPSPYGRGGETISVGAGGELPGSAVA
jgi:hypothetical protein